MVGFNPNSEEHTKGGSFLDVEEDVAVEITEIYRHQFSNGDYGFKAVATVLVGPYAGKTVSRMFKLTGKGTGWTRDLFLAVNNPQGIRDIHDDEELSRAIGMRPFLAEARKGNPFKGRDGTEKQFIEISECRQLTGPLAQQVRALGRKWGTAESLVKEPPARNEGGGQRRVTKEGPNPYNDDYIPQNPGDDDIPF